MQSSRASDRAGASVKVGQTAHSAGSVEAVSVLYVALGQSVHAADPLVSL